MIMCSLNRNQKQALFHYSLGLATEREAAQVERLIAGNQEAADIHSKLQAVFAPLDTLRSEPCPDELIRSIF